MLFLEIPGLIPLFGQETNQNFSEESHRKDWWGMMPVVRTAISLTPRALLSSWFSFGGFGIGNASKSAYDFTCVNAFRVTRLITINASFRNFRYRRVDGSGADGLETCVNVLGPSSEFRSY